MKTNLRTFHAAGDYVIGALLLIGPWLFGFSGDLRASLVTHVFGALIITANLFTDYELALYRRVPFDIRLIADAAIGGLLIGSPWIFGFAATTWVPHLVVGTVLASRACLFLFVHGLRALLSVDDHRRGKLAK
jgi:hypothetical protein